MMTPTSPTSTRDEGLGRGLRRRRSHWHRGLAACSRGFTLLELVIVLTIIAVLFFAFRPGIAGVLREADERTALRQAVSLLNYARTEAVGTGRLVRVLCDPAQAVLWAEVQTDPLTDRSQFDVFPVLGRSQVTVPASLVISSLVVSGQESADQLSQVYFYPDGRTDGFLLTLDGDPHRRMVIGLSAATGRVTISAE